MLKTHIVVTAVLTLCLSCLSCARPTRETERVVVEPANEELATELDQLSRRYETLGRFSGSVALGIGGGPLFAEGYGPAELAGGTPNAPTTRHDLGSLTKQFTAAAILLLESDGRLRVEDPVSAHLPGYPRPQGERVTIHHLLTHTSGIPSLWRLGDGLEDVTATSEPVALDRLIALFQDRELLFEPGARYRYSNSGYVLLAAVVEAVSGEPYAAYLERAIFRPLGMADTGCEATAGDALPYHGYPPEVVRAPSEHPSWSVGDGCVRSTVLDLLTWDAALRDDRLLPAAQREKLFVPHVEIRPGRHYGYGWFLSELHGRPVARHGGASEGMVAEMVRFLDQPLVIVALANYAPRLGINAPDAIVEQMAARYLELPVEPPPAVVELAPGVLERFAGRYAMDAGGRFDVALDDGRLWIAGVGAMRSGRVPSVFDFGALEDPALFDRGAEVAAEAVRAALADDYGRIPLCPPLAEDLAPGELRDEWREALGGRGEPAGTALARVDRYPGEDTLIVVIRARFERGEIFLALDLTPALEVCGWYFMDRAEFELRDAVPEIRRVPLVPIGPSELLADGFKYGEDDVRLTFRPVGDGDGVEILLEGAVEHAGRR